MINMDHLPLNVYKVLVSYGNREDITLKELSTAGVGDLFDEIVFTRYRTRNERLEANGQDHTLDLSQYRYPWWREKRWWKSRPKWMPENYAIWSGGKDEYFKHCCPERSSPLHCPDVAVFIDNKQRNLRAAQFLVPQMKFIHFTNSNSRVQQYRNEWQAVHTLSQLAKVLEDLTDARGVVPTAPDDGWLHAAYDFSSRGCPNGKPRKIRAACCIIPSSNGTQCVMHSMLYEIVCKANDQ